MKKAGSQKVLAAHRFIAEDREIKYLQRFTVSNGEDINVLNAIGIKQNQGETSNGT
jgi:hypothetical protein